LNPQKPETHVPDLPRTQAWFVHGSNPARFEGGGKAKQSGGGKFTHRKHRITLRRRRMIIDPFFLIRVMWEARKDPNQPVLAEIERRPPNFPPEHLIAVSGGFFDVGYSAGCTSHGLVSFF
jgi:hypothetical protein